MITRRDLAIGTACLAAAGAAYGLKPRRRVSLLGASRLEQLIPGEVGSWRAREVADLVNVRTEGGLMAKLYGDVVERVYRRSGDGAEVMMLLAYGDSQTNYLQIHRPEVCYPAFGFEIVRSAPAQLALPGGASLPARQLVAEAPGRREIIVYWTRLGEFLPTSEGEQRRDRLRTAMAGFIADGLLARFSAVGADPPSSLALIKGFIPAFLSAVDRSGRRAFIGTSRAAAMQRAGV